MARHWFSGLKPEKRGERRESTGADAKKAEGQEPGGNGKGRRRPGWGQSGRDERD